jgi:hypothetical protein
MNDASAPTTGQDRRSREIAAKRRVEEASTALEQARRRIGVRESEVRNAQADVGKSAEIGHQAAEALRGAAEEYFRQALREWLPELKNLVRPAPDPLPPEIVAAGILAGYDVDGIYAALHEAIDADVLDPSTATFTVATEVEVDAAVAAKREELKGARGRLEELERELAYAQTEHREVIAGGR